MIDYFVPRRQITGPACCPSHARSYRFTRRTISFKVVPAIHAGQSELGQPEIATLRPQALRKTSAKGAAWLYPATGTTSQGLNLCRQPTSAIRVEVKASVSASRGRSHLFSQTRPGRCPLDLVLVGRCALAVKARYGEPGSSRSPGVNPGKPSGLWFCLHVSLVHWDFSASARHG